MLAWRRLPFTFSGVFLTYLDSRLIFISQFFGLNLRKSPSIVFRAMPSGDNHDHLKGNEKADVKDKGGRRGDKSREH